MEGYKYGKLAATALYLTMRDSEDLACFSDDGIEYKPNCKLGRIYGLLNMLGYKESDEEKAFLDGTHELYRELERIYYGGGE